MKRILFLILSLLLSFGASAQKLAVESFSLAASDISAQTQPRKDLNDAPCALVKVQFVGDILNVKGNVILPLLKEDYETWVYLTHGSRQMQVTAKNYLPLMIKFADYGVESVEKNRTYVLVLSQAGASSNQNDVPSTNSASPTQRPTSIATSNDIITIPVKDGISIDMVKVEAGTFMMGATKEMRDPNVSLLNEEPVHQVTLTNDYYIGKYEVTQALWQAVMGSNPSKYKGDNLPVEMVSWNDCQEFISKLNSMTGRKFRLPTEAEWEYAARGGKKSRGYQYSGSNSISDVAWYSGNCGNISGINTHPVGKKQANELGIYDMTGNVWEWCQDMYGYYSLSAQKNPTGSTGGNKRVIRGGSWFNTRESCRTSDRADSSPDHHFEGLGLRLALSE
ncbi:formylglycine-generating enzyme family protein [Segatella hominis]|uniref:formylglycine-generating enzyme family protein n=1 Tax=Segatella hominis TaxID=2518605 RepID=UPI003AB98732